MRAELTVRGEPKLQREPIIVGNKVFKLFGWTFIWWDLSQIGKWRWQKDHIDLGCLSVYGFKENHLLWRFVAIIIKPLRLIYHSRGG